MEINQSGFSMVELMVVLVIIGILGSFAIPAYQDHIIKTKVMELIAIVQPTKLAVTEALISGKLATEINNESLGLGVIENIGRASSIVVEEGKINVVSNPTALGLSQNETLSLTLQPVKQGGMIQWLCTTTPTEMRKYTPQNCN